MGNDMNKLSGSDFFRFFYLKLTLLCIIVFDRFANNAIA